jgi:hypothetical protein
MNNEITIEIIKDSCRKQIRMNREHDNFIRRFKGEPEIKEEKPNHLRSV